MKIQKFFTWMLICIFYFLFLGCGLTGLIPPSKEEVREAVRNLWKLDAEKEAKEFFDILITPVHEPIKSKNECGFFQTDLEKTALAFKQDGQTTQKGNKTTISNYERSVSEDENKKTMIQYTYNNYRPQNSHFLVTGSLKGTNWNPQGNNITINGFLIVSPVKDIEDISGDEPEKQNEQDEQDKQNKKDDKKNKKLKGATFEFNNLEINNSKGCASFESIVKGYVIYTYPSGVGIHIPLQKKTNADLLKKVVQLIDVPEIDSLDSDSEERQKIIDPS